MNLQRFCSKIRFTCNSNCKKRKRLEEDSKEEVTTNSAEQENPDALVDESVEEDVAEAVDQNSEENKED